jgi:hypothetical protein
MMLATARTKCRWYQSSGHLGQYVPVNNNNNQQQPNTLHMQF